MDSAVRTGSDRLLRLVLKLDAVVTAGNGLAYLALAGVLEDLLGYPPAAQYGVGAFLLVYGLAVLWTATRPVVSRAAAFAYAVVNIAWVVLSLVVLATGALSPTGIGKVWIVLQAVVVGGFAAAQLYALRKAE